jgi:hypothetical protein
MKLKRVVNSLQNVNSATAPNSSSATTNQSRIQRAATIARAPRQRSGNSAEASSHGEIAMERVARSNQRPRTNSPGAFPQPASAGPVTSQSAVRNNAQTPSVIAAATRAKRNAGRLVEEE